MKIAVGFDHGGVIYKEALIDQLSKKGYEVIDCGTNDTKSVDYPIYAKKVATMIINQESDLGILICGTGIGMSIAANKVKGIRAAVANDVYSARLTRLHNDTNILCMGARVIGLGTMAEIVDAWLDTTYMGSHHQKRLDLIAKMEEEFN